MKILLEGGSMRPLLRSGDAAEVSPVRASELRPGDVILYEAGGRRLMHRFAWRAGATLRVFDDAAVVGWHLVEPADLIGRLVGGPLTRGWPGLAYGLFAFAAHSLARPLKTRMGFYGNAAG